MVVASAPPTTSGNSIDISTLKRWSLEDYHRLIELGILQPSDRTELIEGYLVTDMSAHNPAHAQVLRYAMMTVMTQVGDRGIVQYQLPISLAGDSQPEPDIAVVRPEVQRYAMAHPGPDDLSLLIEIASTTLKTDLTAKANLYARNGIIDYWVIDVGDHHVWIHRQPSEDGYQEIIELEQPDVVQAIAPELEGVEIDLRSPFPNAES